MKIPKILKKNNKTYTLVEMHKDYVVYKTEFGYKECFMKHDLGLIKEKAKPQRKNSIFGGY